MLDVVDFSFGKLEWSSTLQEGSCQELFLECFSYIHSNGDFIVIVGYDWSAETGGFSVFESFDLCF